MSLACTIVTVCLNNADGLKKTLDSAVNQTFKNFEHIVIDGGSSDNTSQVLEDYKYFLKYSISEKDAGLYDAMNKGIRNANGVYLLFLNSGDILADNHVLSKIFQSDSNADLIYGNIVFDDKINGSRTYLQPANLSFHYLMKASPQHPSTFIKRGLFEKYGNYDLSFKIAADYDFFLRVLILHNASSFYVNTVVSVFDTTGISSLEINKRKEISEREAAQIRNIPHIVLEHYKSNLFWLDKIPENIVVGSVKSKFLIFVTKVYFKILNFVC